MFRTIWSKSLRDYRVAILAWGLGLGLFAAVDFAESTPTTIAAFGSLAPLFRFLGDPYAIQTPEGFITWRIMEVFGATRDQLLAHPGRSTPGARGGGNAAQWMCCSPRHSHACVCCSRRSGRS